MGLGLVLIRTVPRWRLFIEEYLWGFFFFFKVRSKLQNSDLTSLSDVLSIALLVVEEAERIKKDNETHSGLIREGEKKFKDSQKCERTQENEQQWQKLQVTELVIKVKYCTRHFICRLEREMVSFRWLRLQPGTTWVKPLVNDSCEYWLSFLVQGRQPFWSCFSF